MDAIHKLAFYLPQYHPIAENDAWWGTGFTEWTNVAKARPLFHGHRQPRLPADLGFYDLRVSETRQAQADMARSAGIDAFVYWHYWFGDGRMVLQRPLDEVVSSGEPDFPFCVGWANQSWSGVWYGAADQILIKQTYPGPADIEAHFQRLLPIVSDRRYFRVAGMPLIYVFAPAEIPDPERWCETMRELADREGLAGLYLVGNGLTPPALRGFDAGSSHPQLRPYRSVGTVTRRIARTFLGSDRVGPARSSFRRAANRYQDVLQALGKASAVARHPTILTGWDNTPRSGRLGNVLTGFDQSSFEVHVNDVLAYVRDVRSSVHPKICFVKSWNEWAEGNILEPDSVLGHSILDTFRRCASQVGAAS